MAETASEALFEGLGRGDAAAVARVVADYGPYLRAVVRRALAGPLRRKIDSADVVQSVWASLCRGLRAGAWRARSAAGLRALLATVARRRLVSRFRQHRAALEREQAGATPEQLPASPEPRPSQVAQADETWQRLLRLCGPAHRELLRLRRQGLTLDEVAARTGMHEGSVRRVLRQLARRLALGEDAPDDAGGGPP
jgi:RNA polymerase sigma-70 factor (ECF subfamily)